MDFSNWLIIALIIFAFLVGVMFSQGINTFEKFSLSKNRFNTITLSITILGIYIGASSIIGNAEKTYAHGIVYSMSILGGSLSLILSGIFIAPKLASLKNMLTIGDLINKQWGRTAQILSGVLWLFFSIGIIAIQIAALGKILGLFLPANYILNTLLSACLIISFCSYGGIVAVVTADVVQVLIVCIALPLIVLVGLSHVGGWESFRQLLPPNYLHIMGNMGFLQFSTLFLTIALGGTLMPPVIQRSLMAKNSEQARTSMVLAGLMLIPLIFFAGFLGLLTYVFDNSIYPGQMMLEFIKYMPLWLKGVIISIFIAVIMASADGFLNSGAVCFVNDVIKPLFKKPFLDHHKLRLAKLSTITLGFLAAYVAINIKDILDALVSSIQFWPPTLVVPIGALIFNKKVSKLGFYASALSGLGVLILWEVFSLIEYTTIDGIIPGFLTNLGVYNFFYFKDKIRKAFRNYFDY